MKTTGTYVKCSTAGETFQAFFTIAIIAASCLLASAPCGEAAGSTAQASSPTGESQQDVAARIEKVNKKAVELRAGRTQLAFIARKKLIHNGWDMDVLLPHDIVRNIRQMETAPFDGIVIRMGSGPIGQAPFEPKAWKEEAFVSELESLAAIGWGTFTDNFIWMHCTSHLDWFDDGQWQVVLANTRLLAKAALLGRCAGICFDAENYGTKCWSYNEAPQAKSRSFAQYEAQVRARGRQWMEAVQEVCPRVRILTVFSTGNQYLAVQEYNSTGRDDPLTEETFSPQQIHKQLLNQPYALLPAFINGMIESAQDGSLIIDGNEGAYYYEKGRDYLKYREYFERYSARAFIDEALRPKYAAYVQLGSSFYPDYYYLGRYGKSLATYLTPEESTRWAEHNIYWALKTADEYVWEWGEKQNWWKGRLDSPAWKMQKEGEGHDGSGNYDLANGYEQAVRSARQKVQDGRPLGFESDILFKDVMERIARSIPTVKIGPLSGEAPKIDGKLDDEAWTAAYATGTFVPELDWTPVLKAATKARMCYDDKAIYVGVECDVPPVKGVAPTTAPAPNVFSGDYVVVLVAAPEGEFPVCRFGVNSSGKVGAERVISLDDEKWDDDYKPAWKGAAQTQEGKWTAELAIPWEAIGVKSPQAGSKLRINIARETTRKQPGGAERSSWSPTWRWFSIFMEPKMYATVVLQ